jgi:hypothetical protein
MYVDALRRLGVRTVVFDPLPATPYTTGIAGGTQTSWGLSLTKLVVFNLTQYAKVVFLDADTLAVGNLDHVFDAPHFSAAITHACCNNNAPGIPSGGFWVLQPDVALGLRLWQLMLEGAPVFASDGTPVVDAATGAQARDVWRLSDLALITALFSSYPRNVSHYRYWPWVRDDRHGHVEGVRRLPLYAAMSDAQWAGAIRDPVEGVPLREGFRPERLLPQDRDRPVWHALNMSYDQCVSVCDCLPWRWPAPASGLTLSVHFSCLINGVNKPGWYPSEAALFEALEGQSDCVRHYYGAWYARLVEGLGGRLLPAAPHAAPPPANMTALNARPNHTWVVDFQMRRRRRR